MALYVLSAAGPVILLGPYANSAERNAAIRGVRIKPWQPFVFLFVDDTAEVAFEPVEDPPRCEECEGELPEGCRVGQRFCSPNCRLRSFRSRQKAGDG